MGCPKIATAPPLLCFMLRMLQDAALVSIEVQQLAPETHESSDSQRTIVRDVERRKPTCNRSYGAQNAEANQGDHAKLQVARCEHAQRAHFPIHIRSRPC